MINERSGPSTPAKGASAWGVRVVSPSSPLPPSCKARSAVHPAPTSRWIPRLEARTAVTAATGAVPRHPQANVRVPVCRCTATALLQCLRAQVWCEALHTVSLVLKITGMGIACAWASNWALSLGNVFSGKPPREQGDGEFLIAAALVNYFMLYFVTIATHTAVLRSFRYANKAPEYRPPFWVCFIQLMRMTSPVLATSFAFFIAVGYAVQTAPLSARRNRIGFYAFCPWVHMYTTAAATAVRRIFRRDTVTGQSRASSEHVMNRWRSYWHFWKAYAATLPIVLVVASAGLYVQLVSQVQINSTTDFLLYSASNLALKFVIKKISKLGIVWFKIKDVRSIFVIAGLPTVLINTQVRVMLQRVESTRYTIVWTIVMAVLEIITRVANVFFTKRAVERKRREMRIATLALIPTNALALAPAREAVNRDRVSSASSFQLWRRQTLAFQVAEAFANMAAEYIAIGCSASIVYFYWNHPKYVLNPSRDSMTLSRGNNASQALGIAIQVVVETTVDVVASAFEINKGIDFACHVHKHYDFIALFFMSIAVLNILISSMIYHDPR